MPQSLIHDLLIVLTAGLVAGLVCRWLQASVLIGYLVVGAIVGKGVLNLVADQGHQLEQFAEIGVFFLLFSIGLEFSIDDLKRLGSKLFIGGVTQMLMVAVPVGFVLMSMQLSWQSSILIASAVAFSSTVLVFKSLSEWGQSEEPHGQRAIGILLFQDAALVPLLLLVPLLTSGNEAANPAQYVILGITSLIFVIVVIGLRWLLARWLIPMFAKYRSPDLVILFTLVCLGGVTLAAFSVGLPPAVGAFAAGLIFNGNRWTKQIDALVLPFRETFAAIFFVGLGIDLRSAIVSATTSADVAYPPDGDRDQSGGCHGRPGLDRATGETSVRHGAWVGTRGRVRACARFARARIGCDCRSGLPTRGSSRRGLARLDAAAYEAGVALDRIVGDADDGIARSTATRGSRQSSNGDRCRSDRTSNCVPVGNDRQRCLPGRSQPDQFATVRLGGLSNGCRRCNRSANLECRRN